MSERFDLDCRCFLVRRLWALVRSNSAFSRMCDASQLKSFWKDR
jgi:hypothetical protein